MKQKFQLMELEEALFKELELPNLEKKEQAENTLKILNLMIFAKQGLMGNIDKKRTILSAFKRNAMNGKASISSDL